MCSFKATARLVPFTPRLVTLILVIASEALFAGAGSVLLGSSRIDPSLSVTVLGPMSGSKGTPLGYAANASGGVPPYSYSWACDFNPISPVFLSGLQTQTCSYANLGPHNVKVLVGARCSRRTRASTSPEAPRGFFESTTLKTTSPPRDRSSSGRAITMISRRARRVRSSRCTPLLKSRGGPEALSLRRGGQRSLRLQDRRLRHGSGPGFLPDCGGRCRRN
jgi:hypothetical protein